MNHAIERIDFSIVFGLRSDETQMGLFMQGREKLENGTYKIIGPIVTNCDGIIKRSNHQAVKYVSNAVDIVPYINGSYEWNDKKAWMRLNREIWKSIQILLRDGEIKNVIRWGGFWTSMLDLPHWEIDKRYGV